MLIPGEIPTEFTFIGGALVLTGIYITYSSRDVKTSQES
jgi:drug/metabolite transporter (DMT)-like permease